MNPTSNLVQIDNPVKNCKSLQFLYRSELIIHPHGSKDRLIANEDVRQDMVNYNGIVGICYLSGGLECFLFDEHNNRLSLEQAKQKLLKELDQEITEKLNHLIKLNPYE